MPREGICPVKHITGVFVAQMVDNAPMVFITPGPGTTLYTLGFPVDKADPYAIYADPCSWRERIIFIAPLLRYTESNKSSNCPPGKANSVFISLAVRLSTKASAPESFCFCVMCFHFFFTIEFLPYFLPWV